MDVMTDKEVGELWKAVHESKYYAYQQCAALIRKLVEERAEWYCIQRKVNPKVQACLDFDIDPVTWEE